MRSDSARAGELSQAPAVGLAALAADRAWVSATTLALVASVFLLFWPTTASLIERWQDDVQRTYTHGFLIPLIVAWLLWRVPLAPRAEARFSAPAAVCLLAGAVGWLIAWRAGLQIVHQALLPLLAFGAVVSCLGWRLARPMWLPIGYLYFAIPVWESAIPMLQWLSVVAVRTLLRIVGIPAYFAGNTIEIPAGAFEIADGCSGLHFFVVAVAIGVLYGQVNGDRWSIRLKLVALAGLLAMVTNWLRILIIVIAGHVTDMQHYLVAEEHYSFGWIVFAAAMILFFLVVRRWPVDEPSLAVARLGVEPRRLASAGAGTILLLSVAPAWNVLHEGTAESIGSHTLAAVEGWRTAGTVSDWRPILPLADAESMVRFEAGDAAVEAYVGTYFVQRQGKELAGYGRSILGHSLQATSAVHAVDRRWREVRARDLHGHDWLVRSSYRIDELWFVSALKAQLTYAVRSLVGAPVSSIVAMRARCDADCNSARAALDSFAAAAGLAH